MFKICKLNEDIQENVWLIYCTLFGFIAIINVYTYFYGLLHVPDIYVRFNI